MLLAESKKYSSHVWSSYQKAMRDILNQQDEHISFLLSSTSMWGQSFAHPILIESMC